jgi:CheY-like chemotaxis protein
VVAGFDQCPHALALWDAEGVLLRCNKPFDALFPGPPPRPAPREIELPNGRWVIASEARLPGGARLGLYTEVTALKRPAAIVPLALLPVSPPPPLPTGQLRLLGVDDSPANLSVLRALLSNTGFALETVTDGRAALQALAAAVQAGTPFDAVLMDVMMPGMDGLECTRRIRALPGPLGQIPVIPVTASSFPEDVAACHAAGMTGHVPKPLERVGLMRGIALALRRGDRPEEQALRPLFLNELANRMHELDAALADNRPLLAPVHAIAGTVGHLGGAALVDEARLAMRALRDADPEAHRRVTILLTRLREAYPVA